MKGNDKIKGHLRSLMAVVLLGALLYLYQMPQFTAYVRTKINVAQVAGDVGLDIEHLKSIIRSHHNDYVRNSWVNGAMRLPRFYIANPHDNFLIRYNDNASTTTNGIRDELAAGSSQAAKAYIAFVLGLEINAATEAGSPEYLVNELRRAFEANKGINYQEKYRMASGYALDGYIPSYTRVEAKVGVFVMLCLLFLAINRALARSESEELAASAT